MKMSSNENNVMSREGFSMLSAQEFLSNPEIVRDIVGVYAILVHDADRVLCRTGLPHSDMLPVWKVDGYDHVYTGESVGVRSRLLHHLTGTIRESNFRHSLIALQFVYEALWDGDESRLEALEFQLNDWLIPRTMVAYKTCSLVGDVESDILQRSASPLNIKGRSRSKTAVHLKKARAQFTDHIKTSGQLMRSLSKPRAAWLTDSIIYQRAGEPVAATKPFLR
jgi:hypothetical protein